MVATRLIRMMKRVFSPPAACVAPECSVLPIPVIRVPSRLVREAGKPGNSLHAAAWSGRPLQATVPDPYPRAFAGRQAQLQHAAGLFQPVTAAPVGLPQGLGQPALLPLQRQPGRAAYAQAGHSTA